MEVRGGMKKLINKPEDVVTEELRGIQAAHPDLVKVNFSPNFVYRADAGVVLHDVHDTGFAVDLLARLEHLVRRWRGEDLTRTGCVEHAHPDEAPVHRLVARADARDHGHLALDGRVGP